MEQREIIDQEGRTAQRLYDELRRLRLSADARLQPGIDITLREADKLQDYFRQLGPLVEQMDLGLGSLSRNTALQFEDNYAMMRRFLR